MEILALSKQLALFEVKYNAEYQTAGSNACKDYMRNQHPLLSKDGQSYLQRLVLIYCEICIKYILVKHAQVNKLLQDFTAFVFISTVNRFCHEHGWKEGKLKDWKESSVIEFASCRGYAQGVYSRERNRLRDKNMTLCRFTFITRNFRPISSPISTRRLSSVLTKNTISELIHTFMCYIYLKSH